MLRIVDLLWNNDNESHLLSSHHVTIEEVEDVLLGAADEEPDYTVKRDGSNYVVYGETGGGRHLVIALELISPGYFRPFAARNMEPNERRAYHKRRKTR